MICCLVNVQDDHEEEEDKTQTNHVDSQVDYTEVYCRGTLLNSVWYSVTNNRVNAAVIYQVLTIITLTKKTFY